MDLNTLRKMRNTDFGKIAQEFEKIATPGGNAKSYQDDRVWKLEPDKAGNASATIRFLPKTEGDELPWVKVFSHAFQGPTGKWYIENSLSTIGQDDPLGQLNSTLWNSGSDANKEIARKQKRKLHFYVNILVISDPKHPENEGQVRLFKFGKKIFDKIMDKAQPTFEDEKPVNVFDYWEGADFKLRQRKVEGYPNYDQSVFLEPAAIAEDDETILKIANAQHKLSEFTDPKNFKSFDELKKKLEMVLSTSGVASKSASDMMEEEVSSYSPPVAKSKAAPEPKVSFASEIEDDDPMAYFQSIADGN
jgi:hypothetical protein